ncbi:universal stress protein [Propionicicella superfundia]|uniref:universal stress protein n=1 Tax=Propionicicella superfundia TaxID=348582 RepID=UPI0004906680|nr:universal stress protein [Propionicicella superfundia]
MVDRIPPQPDPSRLTPFAGRPLVVAVTPGQPSLVALTAASLVAATGGALYFAYVDASRYTEDEYPDGTVRHLPINPDAADDTWTTTKETLVVQLGDALAGQPAEWHFRYLAGRVDRSLTHLARAVDAAAIVVGTRVGRAHRVSDFLNGSLQMQLSHRQHRPVLVVPLQVVDWRGRAPWE